MPDGHNGIVHDAVLGAACFVFCQWRGDFPAHFHHTWTIGCLLAGRRRISCGAAGHLAAPGDLVCFNPGQAHACRQLGDERLEWRGLHLAIPALCRAAREAGARGRIRFARPVLAASASRAALLALLAAAGTAATPGRKRALLTALAGALLADGLLTDGLPKDGLLEDGLPEAQAGTEAVSQPARASGQHSARHNTLGRLAALLEREAAETLSLTDMARYVRMDKFALVRAFAGETGLTPWRYLESARVNLARRLLDAGQSPAQTAMAAGFADQSHLTRAFRARLGVTPGAYGRARQRERTQDAPRGEWP